MYNLNEDVNLNDLHLSLDLCDFFYVLTVNLGNYKPNENAGNLIAKSFFVNQNIKIYLWDYAWRLYNLGITKLNLFYLSDRKDDYITVNFNNGCALTFINMGVEQYIKHLKIEGAKGFAQYNTHSMYILKNGDFTDIKNKIFNVEGVKVNIVRGSCQKSHILSPLDFRLSTYMLALFDCNYSLTHSFNSFNELNKKRYLPSYFK